MSRVAIITGASGGIGGHVAAAFGDAGYSVAVLYHANAARADAVLEAVLRSGGRGTTFRVDVTSVSEIESMVSRVQERLGLPSVLVNSAAITADHMAHRMPDEAWAHVLRANLRGTFACCRAVWPAMATGGGGTILNITAAGAERGILGASNYSASKWGVMGLTRSLAKELARYKINVNALSLGAYAGEGMLESLTDDVRASYLARVPLGRWGRPESLASLCVALCEPLARYVTGQQLTVDGGFAI